jgi:hypothetical protein
MLMIGDLMFWMEIEGFTGGDSIALGFSATSTTDLGRLNIFSSYYKPGETP